MKKSNRRIGVIGAGASGLIASCFARGNSNEVLLFEKQQKIARKLAATGNGRCNISNRKISLHDYTGRYHGENPAFAENVFSHFGVEETENFFRSIGIPFIEENDGKLFPASLQAASVSKLFLYEIQRRGIQLYLEHNIQSVRRADGGFIVKTAASEERLDALILSAGSCASPDLGGGNSGYALAKSLGHRIIEPQPVILPINIPLKILHRLQGIKQDVAITVRTSKAIIASSRGELLFTAYGISGPAALAVSRAVNTALHNNKQPVIEIDLFPHINYDELENYFNSVWTDENKKFAFSLLGILKERLGEVLSIMADIDPNARLLSVDKKTRQHFMRLVKTLRLVPGKSRGFKEAVAASGGVATDEINSTTMESKIVKNLFITGELLDIDGDSGGYNLQFAWSSGALAGLAQQQPFRKES